MNFTPKRLFILLKRIFDELKGQTNAIVFYGNSFYCSICQSNFRKFKTFGWKKRKRPKCYKCGSFPRHRLLWRYLNDRFDILNEPIRILHVAPEKSLFKIFSNFKHVEYYPCDLNPEAYRFPNSHIIFKVDITEIPFESDYFDLILCNHVLEHIQEDKKAMSELFRVMKKGGFGIFQVPIDYSRETTYEDFSITDPKERERAFGQFDHVRWYGKDYKNKLEKVGFYVNEDEFVKTFSKKNQFKYGFDSTELIYHCIKTT